MRGKQGTRTESVTGTRITPADAGKTYRQGPRLRGYEDHPRGCGENSSQFAPQGRTQGSPPRMRGKLIPFGLCYRFVRITPADAGKTSSIILMPYPTWDHPRGCGENPKIPIYRSHVLGSPPRMRGKLQSKSKGRMTHGITPADAGKTFR